MDRAAAAERDQGAPFTRLAGFDGVDARGVRHVLVDHFDYAEGRHARLQAERAADRIDEGRLRGADVELEAAAGEAFGWIARPSSRNSRR